MYEHENFLAKRISELRLTHNVSAREMSLSLGQNVNYINHIENKKAMPSMQVFFYICEYFKITPGEFFLPGYNPPGSLPMIERYLSVINGNALRHIEGLLLEFVRMQEQRNA